jgi:hypothetical protein
MRIGRTLGRFVGLTLTLYGLWILGVNIVELFTGDGFESGTILLWVLASGAVAAAGGVVYLLSFDGPPAWSRRRVRAWGLAMMFVGSLLPTSLSFLLLGMLVLAIPSVLVRFDSPSSAKDPLA